MPNIVRCLLKQSCLGLLILASFRGYGVETVRVDPRNGAPCFVVDGQPERARIFFGNPGSRSITIDSAGETVSFDFTALQTTGHGTMQWRFGEIPGDVYLDNIRVVDVDSGEEVIPRQGDDSFTRDWSFWPPTGPENTVGTVQVGAGEESAGSGGVHVRLKAPSSGPWPGFHIYHRPNLSLIQGHHYRVSFWARSEPKRAVTVAFYDKGAGGYTYIGGPETFAPQIKIAASVGVRFVSFTIRPPWIKQGSLPDWTSVDNACQRVLDANPGALLIPRLNVRPSAEWMAAHPDEIMVWNEPGKHATASVASLVYRRDAVALLTALVTHLEEKFGPHMAGYHVCGQNTDEWFYEGTWEKPLNGYGPADLAAWRSWLEKHYGSDGALQVALHDPEVRLAKSAVPSPVARYGAPSGVLRDPLREQPVIDFNDFQQESMADCVCELAHAVRQATHGRKLVLFFYGYVFEFSSVANGPGASGHYALRRILDCPDIDVLCSPISYFDRGMGGGAPCMTAAESIALAGKMYLREDDTYTCLALPSQQPPGYTDAVDTMEETRQELQRNVAQCALRNFATWWMDLPSSGWFLDARLWEVMDRLKSMDQFMLDHPLPYHPEIAAIVDESSMRRVACGWNAVSGAGISGARAPLDRMGAPYGQYLQEDVAAGKVAAKLYVFLSSWNVSPEQRRRLIEATRGCARIWCYAPGYLEGNQYSLDAMRELTGFKIKKIKGVNAWAVPTALGNAVGATAFGLNQTIEPLFAVEDAKPDEVIATYQDGSVAVAMRKSPDGISIFCGPPGLTPELLRFAATKAGVHLYTKANCNVWANGPFLVLHGAQEGLIDVDFGRRSSVVDLLTGKEVGLETRFPLMLKKGETRCYKIEGF